MNAREFAGNIISLFTQSYDQVALVNEKVTDDSPVEHLVDLDISHDGTDFNVYVTVLRMGPTARPLLLTSREYYALGMAAGSFSNGDIDQGVHCVLPVRDSKTGKWTNEVFESLTDLFADASIKNSADGRWHINTLQTWCKDKGIDIN